MKFSEKLAKRRKDNNLSQELLAEKLGVTRQSVSKWESDASYPDMEKIIQLCKILNCNLDDLLEDGIINNNNNQESNNTINDMFNNFLKLITKTYNMFTNMSFKDIIKCIVELLIVSLVLYIISIFILNLNSNLFLNLFNFSGVASIIIGITNSLLSFALVFLSAIILCHIFKIRYLDYYITVEDQNINEQITEKPIKENISSNIAKKERIIIRDPKHSSSSFINFLTSIVILIIKFCLLLVSIPIIFSLILSIAISMALLYHVYYGVIFFFIFLIFISISGILYIILNIINSFVSNSKKKGHINFIIFIICLVMMGVGIGITMVLIPQYNIVDEAPNYKITNNIIDINKVTEINLRNNPEIEIDEKYKNVVIEIKCPEYINCKVSNISGSYFVDSSLSPNIVYKDVLTNLKRHKLTSYSDEKIYMKLYMNNENYLNLKSKLIII